MPKKRKSEESQWSECELTVKKRLLQLREHNIWIALVYEKEWIRENAALPSLPLLIGVGVERLKEIAEMTPGRLWSCTGVAWKDVFKNLGIDTWEVGESVTVKQGTWGNPTGRKSIGGGRPVHWVNFCPRRMNLPLDQLLLPQRVPCLPISRICSRIGQLEKVDFGSVGVLAQEEQESGAEEHNSNDSAFDDDEKEEEDGSGSHKKAKTAEPLSFESALGPWLTRRRQHQVRVRPCCSLEAAGTK